MSSLFIFLLFIYLFIYLFIFFLSNLRLDHSKCIIPTIIRIIQLKTLQLNFPCTILDSCTIAIYSECEFHLVVIPWLLFLFLVRDGAPLLQTAHTLQHGGGQMWKSGHGVASFESRGGPKRISQTLALRSHTGHDDKRLPPPPLPPKTTHHMICLKELFQTL
jgi:hypothetical protein